MIPAFEPGSGRLPQGEHEASWDEILDLTNRRAAQKLRFGGEFFPNVVEGSSGKSFEQFFQTDRDGTPKGIVVIDPTNEDWS